MELSRPTESNHPKNTGWNLSFSVKQEPIDRESIHGLPPYLLTVPASVDAYVAVPNGDPAQWAKEDSQVDVEDVCAAPVEHATFQKDFSTVPISSGSVHDQIDFRFGPSSTDIPSEDSDNVGYGWNEGRAERVRSGFIRTFLSPCLLQHHSPTHGHAPPHPPFHTLRAVSLTTSSVSQYCLSIYEAGGELLLLFQGTVSTH